jgi:hypothetical protein
MIPAKAYGYLGHFVRPDILAAGHNPGMEGTMHEFKAGTLHSSSGQKVTNRKQAIAIGLSQQRRGK